jgi:drug/metabolite transporter (DMT)-like permease
VALNGGERDVDAGTAAMLVNIGPILIALLGGWLLREGFPRRSGAVTGVGAEPERDDDEPARLCGGEASV